MIRAILGEHRGKGNEIASSKIAEMIGIEENATQAKTRQLILECVKQYCLPLASNNRGYFLIKNEAELNEYEANLNSRIHEIEKRKKIVKQNYREK